MCSISRRCSPLPDVQTSIRIASYHPPLKIRDKQAFPLHWRAFFFASAKMGQEQNFEEKLV